MEILLGRRGLINSEMIKLSQITRKDEFHRVVDLSGNCNHYIRGENKDAVVDYHDSVQNYYQVEFANLDT